MTDSEIVKLVRSGATWQEILQQDPTLVAENIRAALRTALIFEVDHASLPQQDNLVALKPLLEEDSTAEAVKQLLLATDGVPDEALLSIESGGKVIGSFTRFSLRQRLLGSSFSAVEAVALQGSEGDAVGVLQKALKDGSYGTLGFADRGAVHRRIQDLQLGIAKGVWPKRKSHHGKEGGPGAPALISEEMTGGAGRSSVKSPGIVEDTTRVSRGEECYSLESREDILENKDILEGISGGGEFYPQEGDSDFKDTLEGGAPTQQIGELFRAALSCAEITKSLNEQLDFQQEKIVDALKRKKQAVGEEIKRLFVLLGCRNICQALTEEELSIQVVPSRKETNEQTDTT